MLVQLALVTRFLSLAFVDIWNSDAPTNGHTYSLLVRHGSVSFVPRMIGCRVVTYLHKLPRCTPLSMRTCSPWVPHSVRRSVCFFDYRDYWRKDPATTKTHSSRQSGPWVTNTTFSGAEWEFGISRKCQRLIS